jgi:hypothetical protein
MSSDWIWQDEDEEIFDCNGLAFDITKAKEFVTKTPRPIEIVRVDAFSGLIEAVPVRLSAKRKAKTDLRVPIFIGTLKNGGRLVIDGWHRVGRAADEGVAELPAVVLTQEETKKIRCRI